MTLTAPEQKRKARAEGAGAASGVENSGVRLLAWYDRHRRDLPWRAQPGEPPDPYRVWVSEIMLQQTTVGAVVPYYLRFLERFATVESLAAADLNDVLSLWAGLGYYARGRNLHACARVIVDRRGGKFPRTLAELRALPGIGDYTAAAIAAIAYDAPVVPVDGNISRVVARLFAIDAPLPRAKPEIRDAAARLLPKARAGDFAQALMDLGATICTPKSPACLHCPLRGHCLAQARGTPENFPVKEAKRQGRLRRGAAFVVRRADGALLMRTRPAKGLLGGMTEVPTTVWTHDFDAARALAQAPVFAEPVSPSGWRRLPGAVIHVFTHFPLELIVYLAALPAPTAPPAGMRWVARADLAGEALPGVMRKVLAHAGIRLS
jgi:A/G-specific adenine glycosylase